ncbi:MAG: hypothetical protein KU37_06425 [Sulfuricurvum sp. PC08-66]|nr:MAG: hypothetical protein KU37_06425 [Sulfuricurvum sp. PC08-66]
MHKLVLFLLALTLSWATPSVSTQWVEDNLKNPKLVLVDTASDDVFALEGHIPNAVLTPLSAWRYSVGKHFLVRDARSIEAHMRSLGIDNDSHVVLYSHINSPKDFLVASYIYWAMKHYGLAKVSIMDGGFNQWNQEKRPTTQEESISKKGTFVAKASKSDMVDLAYVKAHIGKVPMIDARPAENYFGAKPSDGVVRLGHIAGAMSYFWGNSIEADYRLKSLDVVAKQLAQLAPNKKSEVIVYCTGGLETSYNYFVLAGYLGYTNVKLYDASMREWGNREDTPMRAYVWEMFAK